MEVINFFGLLANLQQESSQDEALHALYVLYTWYHKKTDPMSNCT